MDVMSRAIPDAECVIVAGAGHPVHFEFPELVGPRIIDFLTRAQREH
jgi:pimeloyl-ACP methyl ester carboxylesterase